MRLAVISDIHCNYFALEHVLEDIRRQGIEQIVCLGDVIQGGAQPAETIQCLRALGCPVVMGNTDDRLLTGLETSPHEQMSEQQQAIRAWTLAQLSSEDLAYIRQFQPAIEIPLEAGMKLLCFHGSPHSYDDILLPDTADETFRQLLGGFDATLLTGGHTHTQQLRRLGNAWYFNPGSVALTYNWELSKEGLLVDPWADYAIVSSEGACFGITFRHVPFDVAELSRIMRATGRPYVEQAIAMYQHRS
jgi:putative phosphoesterase